MLIYALWTRITAKKPGVYAEKYGSWSRIPESANRDKLDIILAFYCIDPFPQTHKANSK